VDRELEAAFREVQVARLAKVDAEMFVDVEKHTAVIPMSKETLDDYPPGGLWASLGAMLERAQQDAEWLARMRPAQRARVLRMRALIQRAADGQRERERAERVCPTCGHDPWDDC
jgi:hypothetical protein